MGQAQTGKQSAHSPREPILDNFWLADNSGVDGDKRV